MNICNIRFIPFPTDGEQTIVRSDCVLFCRSAGECTQVALCDGSFIEAICCLNTMEQLLEDSSFFRCHPLYLINGENVKELFVDGTSLYARTYSGNSIPVSIEYCRNVNGYLRKLIV